MARPARTDPVLTPRALDRALLARQLLLERVALPIPDAIEQVAPLQTQYAPSGYVGLWTRLVDFRRAALTEALEDRSVIQASLMRTTIHMVSRREYWRYEVAVREARRAWNVRVLGERGITERQLRVSARRLAEALDDGPKTVKELDGLVKGFLGNASIWLDLVRVPPSGTWDRRRADRIALADVVGRPGGRDRGGRPRAGGPWLPAGIRPSGVEGHRLVGGHPGRRCAARPRGARR